MNGLFVCSTVRIYRKELRMSVRASLSLSSWWNSIPSKAVMGVVVVLLAVVGALAVMGLGGSKTCSFSGGSMTLDGNDLEIALDANPTTGYEWSYALDGDALTVSDQGYDEQDDDSGLVGAPTTYRVSVTGEHAGECSWDLSYARSWSDDTVQELSFVVTVGDSGKIVSVTGTDLSGSPIEIRQ